MTNRQKLIKLRELLKAIHMDVLLLPVTDEYQGEYSADYARRVTWLTGFDGSAGMAVIGTDKAALLVDGRYTLQARNEVDDMFFDVYDSAVVSLAEYVREYVKQGAQIAYDPWLHTVKQIGALSDALGGDASLIPHTLNLVDAIWDNQPARPLKPIVNHDETLAGRSIEEKLADVHDAMQADALLLTEPDAICWLLNIRGADIPYNPLPLCYAIIEKTGQITLITSPEKVVHCHLPPYITVVDDPSISDVLAGLKAGSLQYDPAKAPIWFVQQLEGVDIKQIQTANPVNLLKAIKNPTEIANMRRAHEVDGVAVTKFCEWFNNVPDNEVVTELDVIAKLEAFRADHPDYLQPSFATIAGSGEHGAIVHYRADERSNRKINDGDALLVDSGGQYAYGTTDITRTLFRGEPTIQFKRHFTLVLKGHIALAMAQFPEGTTGSQLDILARQYLWAEGLDYKHGTGHGVGHYLCVHEGPQSISSRPSTIALQPGMILSNEPGYYLQDHYGIRIESLILVVEKGMYEGQRFLGFETLSRAPIDERLVDGTLLTNSEREWLRDYNQLQ